MCVYVRVCRWVCACVCIYLTCLCGICAIFYTKVCLHIYRHTHTYIHTHTHTDTHTHTHTHTYTHTHTRLHKLSTLEKSDWSLTLTSAFPVAMEQQMCNTLLFSAAHSSNTLWLDDMWSSHACVGLCDAADDDVSNRIFLPTPGGLPARSLPLLLAWTTLSWSIICITAVVSPRCTAGSNCCCLGTALKGGQTAEHFITLV